MTINEIETRLAAINAELDTEGADLDALETETRSLLSQRDELRTAEEKRARLRAEVAAGAGEVARRFDGPEKRDCGVDSAEYRSAFFKNLLRQDMTVEERAAFVHTTANSGDAPLPTTTLTSIWDLITGEHSIMEDITVYRTGVALEVVKHTTVVAGKAKKVAEGAANDDEQNTFVKIKLTGNDFSKHVDISYGMAKMSAGALEEYLVKEIARQLGEAMAEDVVANAIVANINSANKVAATTVTFAELAKAFGKLKRAKNKAVYGSSASIYTHLAGLVDDSGRPVFQPNAQDAVAGTLLGAKVRIEDAVPDGQLLIGAPSQVVYNMVEDIMIERDKDIKAHTHTFAGYARGEGALMDDLSFVLLTIGG